MENTEDNNIGRSDLNNAYHICTICLRCEDDKVRFLEPSEYSQNVFLICSKYMRSTKFWKTVKWSLILKQDSLMVCKDCYEAAEKIYKINEQVQNLQNKIKNSIRKFTNEVMRCRSHNVQEKVKEEVNQFISDEEDQNDFLEFPYSGDEISVDIKKELDDNYDEGCYNNQNLTQTLCPSNAITDFAFQDNLHTFTNSSGYNDTVLLRGLRVELKRLKLSSGLRFENATRVSTKIKKKRKIRATQHRKSTNKNAEQQSEKIYKCSTCEKSSNSIVEMKAHIKIHEEKSPEIVGETHGTINGATILRFYQCKTCLKIFNTRGSFHYHVQRHILKDGLICNICGKKLLNKDTLKQHLHLHTSEGLKCQFCDHWSKTKVSLQRHTVMTHTVETPFECKLCPRKFKMKIEFNKHVRRHEERSKRPYQCIYCVKTFTRPSHLKNHEKIHTGDLLKCDFNFCDKKFCTTTAVKQHVKLVHTKDVSYMCEICGQSMKSKYSLDLHNRKHTGEKPFVCNLCGKSFIRKQYLEEHSKKHTGETFQCNICFRTVVNKSNFKKHMRTHKNIEHNNSIAMLEQS